MEKFCDVILMTFFGGVMMIKILKWRHYWFLKFNFFIISLKIHNLAKSRNFKLPILKV